ncbi:hypothetical protein, partial [Acinetobacter baumannii]|uniref:hypothetical protein n=1 Tax=Acinetobacter baumannii TaxID=470 RepID=UPI003F698B2C
DIWHLLKFILPLLQYFSPPFLPIAFTEDSIYFGSCQPEFPVTLKIGINPFMSVSYSFVLPK